MSTGGGMLGNIGGQVAQMALPGSMLGKVGAVANAGNKLTQLAQGTGMLANVAKVATNPIAQAAAGGASFAATQPVLSDETRGGNMLVSALGGAAGQGVASGVGALARPAKAALSPTLQALATKAEQMGIPVSAAQLSDSKFVQTLASTLEKLPFTGAQQSRNAQNAAFNKALSNTIGENVDAITPDVMAAAKGRIGSEFERIAGSNAVQIDNTFMNRIGNAEQEALRNLPPNEAKIVQNQISDILDKVQNGTMDGKAYQAFRTDRLLKLEKSNNPFLSSTIKEIRSALDDAFNRSVSGADADALTAARSQYRNLKTIQDLAAKSPDGVISPALLLNKVRQNNPNFAYGGGGDIGDLARIGQQFIKDKIPDSGTAQRLMALGALGGGSYAVGVDPQTALLTVAGGATVGRGLNKLMNSQTARQYMMNGSAGANRLAELLTPLPYLTAPTALNLSR
jgi:hypothetical protein